MGNEIPNKKRIHHHQRFATHDDITRAAKKNDKDGLCPVCHELPSAIGITCGGNRCRTIWITGSTLKWSATDELADREDLTTKIK